MKRRPAYDVEAAIRQWMEFYRVPLSERARDFLVLMFKDAMQAAVTDALTAQQRRGGLARARALTPKRRQAIASQAAHARWDRRKPSRAEPEAVG